MKPCLYLITFFFLFSVAMHCRKDKNSPSVELPPVTQEGKNTFGCKVNGEIWIPYYECTFSGNPCGEFFTDVYRMQPTEMLPLSFSLSFGNRKSNNTSTRFHIETKGIGIWSIGDKKDSVTFLFSKPVIQLYYNYYNKVQKFEIIKLDTVNNIISGVFALTLYQSINDSVEITEGRFDLKFPLCKCSN